AAGGARTVPRPQRVDGRGASLDYMFCCLAERCERGPLAVRLVRARLPAYSNVFQLIPAYFFPLAGELKLREKTERERSPARSGPPRKQTLDYCVCRCHPRAEDEGPSALRHKADFALFNLMTNNYPSISRIMPSVYIKTYGCQMNERDSEAVAAQLVAKGYA